jgi:hypothetical protein
MKAELTELWHQCDSGQAVKAGLEERGYILARGDKDRIYCVIDAAGDEHSLTRTLKGVRTAEMRAKMADVDRASLPSDDDTHATTLTPIKTPANCARRRRWRARRTAARLRPARPRCRRRSARSASAHGGRCWRRAGSTSRRLCATRAAASARPNRRRNAKAGLPVSVAALSTLRRDGFGADRPQEGDKQDPLPPEAVIDVSGNRTPPPDRDTPRDPGAAEPGKPEGAAPRDEQQAKPADPLLSSSITCQLIMLCSMGTNRTQRHSKPLFIVFILDHPGIRDNLAP